MISFEMISFPFSLKCQTERFQNMYACVYLRFQNNTPTIGNCSGNCKNNSLFLMLAYQAIQIEDIYVYIYIYIYIYIFEWLLP